MVNQFQEIYVPHFIPESIYKEYNGVYVATYIDCSFTIKMMVEWDGELYMFIEPGYAIEHGRTIAVIIP